MLRHIRTALPAEHLVYLADAGFAPYGDRSEPYVVARSLAIADFLVGGGAKALVVACNTATAAAIGAIRARYPALPVIGVEPGLKPAAEISCTRRIGVLATAATLGSERFARLQREIETATAVRFFLQACPGLADQIEKGELRSPATARMVARLVHPLLDEGVDTLVLGCTHYPFVRTIIEASLKREFKPALPYPVSLVDTGSAVARQLEAVLRAGNQLHDGAMAGTLAAYTTGHRRTLSLAFCRLLSLSVTAVEITPG